MFAVFHHSGRLAAPVLAALLAVTPLSQASEATVSITSADLDAASIRKGKGRGAVCRGCHKVREGEQGGMGPNLWNVFNRKKAAQPEFNYSKVLQQAGGRWDPESLDRFLTRPGKYLPGTRMTFGGIKKQKDRANVIAWLRSLSVNQ